ncbi:MAG: restriction endonuclease subunit R [Flavobacteriales bacterium]|nr:restriction endonuclease subunit R [Flavobacteriales bacterium]|tara:strand:- start:52618 stop:53073 length:456 start_codon:yes stop_codon:yes gene_type:complete
MQQLNLPSYQFKLIQEDKKTKIFDAIRKKYLLLTAEEWVRQNFIEFLVRERNFPRGLIAVEKGLKLNGLQKRSDILIYSKSAEPILMVECKAPEVKIDQSVFDQIARYNIHFKLPFLVVTNGLQHYCAQINFENKDFSFLKDIPNYNDISK